MDDRSEYTDGVLRLQFDYIDKEFTRLHKTLNGLPGDVTEIKTNQGVQGRQLETIERTMTGGRWSKATVIPLVIGVSSVLLMFATIILSLVSLF